MASLQTKIKPGSMHNKNLTLSLARFPDLRLRAIGQEDIENLRTWKNENKNSFFLKQEITPEQQWKWYQAFSTRNDDHMFIVEQLEAGKWTPIGCMGFRELAEEGNVDAYNIIRSKKIGNASFTMSEAFRLMLAYASSLYPQLPLRVKVLSHNPAVAWYEKNDFSKIGEQDGYFAMELNKDSLNDFKGFIK
jgi:RimJ/RimL family protein N-acetyltransferase